MNKYPVYKDKNDNLYLVDEKKKYGIRLWSKDKSSMFRLKGIFNLKKTNRRLQIKIPPLILFPNNITSTHQVPIKYPPSTHQVHPCTHNIKSNDIRVLDLSKIHLGNTIREYTTNDPYIFSLNSKIYTHPKGSARLFSIDLTKSRIIINGMYQESYFDDFMEDQAKSMIYPPNQLKGRKTPMNSDKFFFDSEGTLDYRVSAFVA